MDANRHLGFDDDLRSYEAVEYILSDMGIKVRCKACSAFLVGLMTLRYEYSYQ